MIEPAVSLSSSSLVVAPTGFRPNTVFLGFQLEMDQLAQKLTNQKRRAIGTCAVLLWGPPGCGKSQIAREYLWRHRTEYPVGCFWVDCKTRESQSKSFWDIAQAVLVFGDNLLQDPSTKYVEAVRKWLEAREGWLLVLDGITTDSEDDIEALVPFIPDRSGNNIIYTSVDRTLAKRQRLLNPSGVKVFPLSQHDACKLLFRNLEIKSPSEIQVKKANQLVKHYECLPLAIHAAAHALIARGVSLEKFTPGTSDHRLAEPYLDILAALREHNHPEAVNLITVLSFFAHVIPVALIRFGQPVLHEFGVEIRALESIGSMKKELDNTIAVLIRYGLVERTLLEYCVSSYRSSSPEAARTRGSTATSQPRLFQDDSSSVEAMVPRSESRTDTASSHSVTYSIDIIRVHTVVQNVFRDELRLRYADQPARYWWWLSLASKMLDHSYTVADNKIKGTEGRGLVRDYRDYETQAARLFQHFPKSKDDASPSVRKSRHNLHETIRAIRQEIKKQSPSQSFDSLHQHFQYSVFERANSTSSDSPGTNSTNLTRTSTWSPDHPDNETESPMQMQPPHDFEDAASDSWTDKWSSTDNSRILIPNNPQVYAMSSTESHARDSAVLQAIFQGRTLSKKAKDLGEWKPLAIPPTLSQEQVQVVRSRASSFASNSDDRTTRPTLSTGGSEASNTLAKLHRASPPPARGGRIKSPSRGECTRSSTEDARQPLASRSTNQKLSPLAMTFEPGKPGEAERRHQRNPSSSPRLIQTALNNQAATRFVPVPALDGTAFSKSVPLEKPSAPFQRREIDGYMSQPMSRDPSRESDVSLATAPPAVPGSASLSNSPQLTVPYLYSRPGLASIDVALANSWSDDLAGLDIGAEDDIFERRPGSVQFGALSPVDIEEARIRAELARERSFERR
jgi:hypothetical protein